MVIAFLRPVLSALNRGLSSDQAKQPFSTHSGYGRRATGQSSREQLSSRTLVDTLRHNCQSERVRRKDNGSAPLGERVRRQTSRKGTGRSRSHVRAYGGSQRARIEGRRGSTGRQCDLCVRRCCLGGDNCCGRVGRRH
jgi:hypothetical protein